MFGVGERSRVTIVELEHRSEEGYIGGSGVFSEEILDNCQYFSHQILD